MKNENQQDCGRTGVMPASERLRRWERRYDADRVHHIIEEAKAEWMPNVVQAFERVVKYEEAMRQVLSEHTIQPGLKPSYMNFARQLMRAHRLCAGVSLDLEARQKYLKWYERGLDPAIMRELAERLFNILLPENPGDAALTGEGA